VTGGKVFEQPDKKRELTRQEKQDIEVFGQVTERTHSRMVAEHNFTVENVGRGRRDARRVARCSAPTTSQGRGHRPPGGDAHGRHGAVLPRQVSALSQETDGRIASRSRSSPASPRPVRCARPTRATAPTRKWVEGFRLPAPREGQDPASLVVGAAASPRAARRGVWAGEAREGATVRVRARTTSTDTTGTDYGPRSPFF
jgi:hypothetical protein